MADETWKSEDGALSIEIWARAHRTMWRQTGWTYWQDGSRATDAAERETETLSRAANHFDLTLADAAWVKE